MSKRPRESQLQLLDELVARVKSERGSKGKVDALVQYGQPVRRLLNKIYDRQQVFGVTKTGLKKELKKTKVAAADGDLGDLMDTLSSREATGQAALDLCCGFIKANKEYEDLVLCALDKDLKMKAGAKLINKALPDCIPCFEVTLGYDIEKHKTFYEKNKDKFSASRKLDGVRCLIMNQQAYSRPGKIYPRHNIDGLDQVLSHFDLHDKYLFDGEMVVINQEGKEDFKKANSLMSPTAVKDKKGRPELKLLPGESLQFWCFDIIDKAAFERGAWDMVWSKRQELLRTIFPVTDVSKILEQTSDHEALWKISTAKEWEGIYFAYDGPWKSGRSRSWLKKKTYEDHEFVCVGAEDGPMLVPGTCEEEVVLAHVLVQGEVDGKQITSKVGSGFSRDERRRFIGDSLVGKVLKIRYTELSQSSKSGENQYSLRFPRFLAVFK